jgi:hypothetical protein
MMKIAAPGISPAVTASSIRRNAGASRCSSAHVELLGQPTAAQVSDRMKIR